MINGCLLILNFSFCIQLKIFTHSLLSFMRYQVKDLKRKIPYVLALINFYNFMQRYKCIVLSDSLRELVLFVVKHS